MAAHKRLYKDRENKMFLGILAGFSQYINGDVTLVRILFVLLTLVFHLCIIIYIAAAVIIPDKNEL